MDPKYLQVCSALMIPNKPIQQPTFSFTNWARELDSAPIIHICGPCAHTCFGFDPSSAERHPDIDILDDIRELKKPFFCGCKGLKKSGHKCYWSDCKSEELLIENGSAESSSSSSSLIELGWRREARSFLEDLCYNNDIDDAYGSRNNAKNYEKMTKSLRQQHELFDQYFDDESQNAARRCIPIAKLVHRAKLAYETEKAEKERVGNDKINAQATEKIDDSNDNENNNNNNIYQALADPNLHDHILKQLLHWFKHDFFKWVDQPICETCNEKTVSFRPPEGSNRVSIVPTPEEKQNWASVIELYICKNCSASASSETAESAIIRFPRYNRAKRLLTWRKGRCGEWTNCFALCCISLGFETRFVLDLTDHVWVEVWSTPRKRFIHLDPCENAFDSPLMYSKGWGKKLNYIFAISQNEIVDVTRRYTEEPTRLETRVKLSELSLSHLVRGMNWFANKRCPQDKLALLEQRAMQEREQLSQAGGEVIRGEDPSASTFRGRQSGSKSWKSGRNEGGTTNVEDSSSTASRSIGVTSADPNGLSSLDSISVHAGSLFSESDEERIERVKRTEGGMNMIQFAEEALFGSNLSSTDSSTATSTKMIVPRPKWIWKGGKHNVVQLLTTETSKTSRVNNEDDDYQQEDENSNNNNWFAFRFASGSSCQLSMISPGSETFSSSSNPPPAIGTLPSWTTHPSSNLPTTTSVGQQQQNNMNNNRAQALLFPYPTKEMINAPRLPVPFSADRLSTIVDEFCCSMWFVPYFILADEQQTAATATTATSTTMTTKRGIIGFSVGKTFRVDVSWEFKIENDADLTRKEGTLKIALSIRHIDLPMMSSPEQQATMKTKKWSENFSAVEPVGIWDTKQCKAHVSTPSQHSTRRVVFEKVSVKTRDLNSNHMIDSSSSSSSSSSATSLFVLKSSSAIQLFAALDKQGALTANCFQKVPSSSITTTNATGEKQQQHVDVISCATAGSMVPLFLVDRGAVSLKVHGLETLLESVQISW